MADIEINENSENNKISPTVQNTFETSRVNRTFLRKILRKKKQCSFCIDKITKIDYKEGMRLRKYVSERAKILPRRITGMCAYHQRVLAKAIKKARFLALIPCNHV